MDIRIFASIIRAKRAYFKRAESAYFKGLLYNDFLLKLILLGFIFAHKLFEISFFDTLRAPTQRSFSALPDGICARAVDNSVDNVDKCAYSREIAARTAVDSAVHTAAKPAVKSTAKSDVDRRSASNPFASEVRPYAGRVRRTESNPTNCAAVS
mgnify:FL=1